MGWIIFSIFGWSTALLLVPLKYWKRSWPVGIFAMVIIFIMDDTLAKLDAFKFLDGRVYLSSLPLFYWLAYFPGGIIFDHFRPQKHVRRLLYIFVWATGYLVVELFFIHIGYFRHLNWNLYKSFLLNVCGFTLSMWFSEWMQNLIFPCRK